MNKKYQLTLKTIFVLIIFYFLFRILANNWETVQDYDFSFNYALLFLSLVFFIISIFYRGYIWSRIIFFLSRTKYLSTVDAMGIAAYSNIGKYVPGKIWGVLGAVYLGAKKQAPKNVLAQSYVLQTILGVFSSFVISVALLFTIFREVFLFNTTLQVGLYSLMILLILFFVFPSRFYIFLNKILKNIKKINLDIKHIPSRQQHLTIFFHLFIVRLINGLAFYVFVKSFMAIDLSMLVYLTGVYIVSNIVAVFAFFSPGGLGAKEGALAYLLQYYFPLGIAVFISVLARMVQVMADVLAVALFYLFSRVRVER